MPLETPAEKINLTNNTEAQWSICANAMGSVTVPHD